MLKKIFFGLCILGLAVVPLRAQFNSGSSGKDGAFNPTQSTTLQCPESDCVFNFTTVTIPAGVTVTFIRNSFNAPVMVLATGDVTITGPTGTISVDGVDGASFPMDTRGGDGGPGGFRGGDGGKPASADGDRRGGSGLGPGGGFATLNANSGGGSFAVAGGGPSGPTYGTPSLLPIVGGSGGGGGHCNSCDFGQDKRGGGGGGGGGALIIASSGTITINGVVSASGGKGGNGSGGNFNGGGGSGGAIRLIANAIIGTGSVRATGGDAVSGGGNGRIRLESGQAIPASLTTSPGPSVLMFQPFAPPAVTPSGLPSLRIATVDGMEVPNPPLGHFTPEPDVRVANPGMKPVVVAGSGIPLGTTVTVAVKPEGAAGGASTTVTSGPLMGTVENSTATATVNLPALAAYFLEARATFTVPATGSMAMKVNGEPVKQVRVETAQGTGSRVTYILESGREVPAVKLP